jgi:hypothetical protein
MNERRIPLIQEEPKHKKKSQGNGLPRSKHKHIYETVLLTKYYHGKDFKTGFPSVTVSALPTRVCTICGRIGETDTDCKYYKDLSTLRRYRSELSEEAFKLPKWYADDFWDKFAHKGEKE